MRYDVLVLGSGPAGFYCALRCARAGRRTILVEKDRLGGTGFRWGCLPVKMMLDGLRAKRAAGAQAQSVTTKSFGAGNPAAIITQAARRIREIEARIQARLSAAGVQVLKAVGCFEDPNTYRAGNRLISASRIVIATGTEPAGWPDVSLDGKTTISHREVLSLTQVPEHLLILGGDVEGIEFACLFARLGARVTVIEKERRILPGTDQDLVEPIRRDLLARGVSLRTGVEVRGCAHPAEAGGHRSAPGGASGAVVSLSDRTRLAGDLALVTGLRRPNFPEGLEQAGVRRDGQKIPVNADLQTSCPTIYAVGDMNGIAGTAHAAIQQGLLAARRIIGSEAGSEAGMGSGSMGGGETEAAGKARPATPAGPPYPRAIYTLPEIAGAGYQETELEAAGIPYRGRSYRLGDTWRGFSKGVSEGFVKVLIGRDERILGIWICGPDASEQASLFGPLLAGSLTTDTLRDGLILHPTLGEAVLEAVVEASRDSDPP